MKLNKIKDIRDTIKLYKEHNVYNHLSKDDVAQHIIPSISLNQYKIFRYDSTGVAYAFTNWAFLNKEVENNFKQTGILNDFDWNSGKNCWHIDTISTASNKLKDIYKWTINNLSNCLEDDNYINWIRLNNKGNKVKRINRMTLKEGKRKFVGKAA
jgi:hemolysin-activating ACP:hemolysin acyltransferase